MLSPNSELIKEIEVVCALANMVLTLLTEFFELAYSFLCYGFLNHFSLSLAISPSYQNPLELSLNLWGILLIIAVHISCHLIVMEEAPDKKH